MTTDEVYRMLGEIAGKIRRRIGKWRIRQFEAPFRKVEIKDRSWVEAIRSKDSNLLPQAHFVQMYLTQAIYDYDTYREFCGCVIKKPWIEDGILQWQYPTGAPEDRKRVIEKVLRIYASQCREVVFCGASDDGLKELQEQFGERVSFVEDCREGACYMLDVQEQIELPGGEFRNKRKKIARFNKNYAWTYEAITTENKECCLEINERWLEGRTHDETLEEEQKLMLMALRELERLELQGGLFRIDGKPAAFYIGTPFNDTVYMSMFMKADNSYQDIALALTHAFFSINCQNFRYDNEDCDCGVPGLRDFKTNLHPSFMVPYYYVTVRF